MANNIQRLALLLIVCAIFSSCYHHYEYHIEPYSHNGGLTIDVNLYGQSVMCSFSNDSITDGGYITFKALHRDASPIKGYFVAPDSIFILDSYVEKVKSQGFNIYMVRGVRERGDTSFEMCLKRNRYYPTYYEVVNNNDTLKMRRVSFIEKYTYKFFIYNDEISVHDSTGNRLIPEQKRSELGLF